MRDFFRFLAGLIVFLAAGAVQAQNWQPEWTSGTLSQARELAAAAAGRRCRLSPVAGPAAARQQRGGHLQHQHGQLVDGHVVASTRPTWRPRLRATTSSLPAAGRAYSNVVDIYNTSTNTWLTATLSQPRGSPGGRGRGQLRCLWRRVDQRQPYYSNAVDIYNTSTNTWSTATLSQARCRLAAAAAGNDVVFAGGVDSQRLQQRGGHLQYQHGHMVDGHVVAGTLLAGGRGRGQRRRSLPAANPTAAHSNAVDIYNTSTALG